MEIVGKPEIKKLPLIIGQLELLNCKFEIKSAFA
jgi:hypothetical protein